MVSISSLVRLVACAAVVNALRRGLPRFSPAVPVVQAPDEPITDKNGNTLPPLNTTYFFDQLIDHNDPSKGTFKQRFWSTWQFFEPGGPIILMTPGEANAAGFTGYLTNSTFNGQLAQASNGSTIVLEHRFFGLSNPIPNLEDDSLKLLTIDQATKDLTYFAKNVVLPQPGGDKLSPTEAPWVLVGGSYAGALTSWTFVNQPGVFWAGYASSAVVEAVVDYWGYFEPIRQNMPKNCSADVEAVIAHVDKVFTFGSNSEKQALKELFGMGEVSHLDDVASTLRFMLFDWQDLQPYVGPNATFFQSCDALEVKDGVSAPTGGWGLDHALQAWGAYYKDIYIPSICGDDGLEDCLGSHNATQDFYTNTTVDNANRSWTWSDCNEVGYLQDGAPLGWPTIISRLVQPSYDERQCTQFFPKALPKPRTPNAAATNQKFGGWKVNLKRVFFANGKQDPWREATMSSDFHARSSTSSQPVFVGNGFHCSDLLTRAAVDPTVADVTAAGVATISNWLLEWPGARKGKTKTVPAAPAFVPQTIPDSIVSASPLAIPAAATQVFGTAPQSSGSTRHVAIENVMVRPPVVLRE